MICPKCKKQIDDDSNFCEFCGARIINAGLNEEKKNHYRKSKCVIVLVTALVVILLISGTYFGSYYLALKYAENMDYSNTVKFSAFMGVTEKHDPEFVKYVNAWEELNNGNSYEARLKFEELSDYLHSQELIKECYYKEGIKCFENKKYEDAAYNFRKVIELSGTNKDVEEQFVKSIKQYVYELLGQDNYSEAIGYVLRQPQDIKGKIKGIFEIEKEITPIVYKTAVKLYRSGEYSKANDCFSQITDYEDSLKYCILSNYHRNRLLGDLFIQTVCENRNCTTNELISELDLYHFEDGNKILP